MTIPITALANSVTSATSTIFQSPSNPPTITIFPTATSSPIGQVSSDEGLSPGAKGGVVGGVVGGVLILSALGLFCFKLRSRGRGTTRSNKRNTRVNIPSDSEQGKEEFSGIPQRYTDNTYSNEMPSAALRGD